MAFKALAEEVQSTMLALLQNSNETANSDIYGVKVISFGNGSVIANMTVASNVGTLSTNSVQNSINVGIANGNLSSLAATGTVQAQGMQNFVQICLYLLNTS